MALFNPYIPWTAFSNRTFGDPVIKDVGCALPLPRQVSPMTLVLKLTHIQSAQQTLVVCRVYVPLFSMETIRTCVGCALCLTHWVSLHPRGRVGQGWEIPISVSFSSRCTVEYEVFRCRYRARYYPCHSGTMAVTQVIPDRQLDSDPRSRV